MDKQQYQQLVKKNKPTENRLWNGFLAFLAGGIMGLIGQGLTEFYAALLKIPTKEASSFMIITLIFIGCLFTCFGFFDKLVHKFGAGLFVPITGFAHAMMSAALDYRKEGMITGLGANMFKLTGSVIVFGVVSAYVFGILRIVLFGGAV